MANHFAIIMSGGKGTRLWPKSTESQPKQYIPLINNKSLLRLTSERLGFIPEENVWVVTTEDQKLDVMREVEYIHENQITLEPEGRNTAPCIFLSLQDLMAQGAKEEDIVAIIPSDHMIKDHQAFSKTLNEAYAQALEKQTIILIGIKPDSPHTGYGYLEAGEKGKILSFKEKPDQLTAQNYFFSGRYFWNSGIFVASIQTFLKEFKEHCPDYFKRMKEYKKATNDQGRLQAYSLFSATSFDYAVLEKCQNVSMIEADFDWNDLGSWSAFEKSLSAKDQNYILSSSKVETMDSKNNIICVSDLDLALIGINDLVIVQEGNKLLISIKSRSQEVKEIQKRL